MKKILVIPSWYPTRTNPLRGSFFKEQAEFLNQSGKFEIKILFGELKSQKLLKCLWIYFKVLIGLRIKLDPEFSFQSPKSFYFEIPNNRRIPDRALIYFSKKYYLLAFEAFILDNEKPELLHAQSGMDAGIYTQMLSKKFNIPFVIIEHQVFIFHYYSRLKAKLVLEAFESADKTAAVSYDERRQVLMNQPNCNPKVIWNLVNEDKYQILEHKRNKLFTIVTILNSFPIKGSDTFLESMLELSKMIHDFQFIMIGNGADENSKVTSSNLFIQQSKQLGIYDFGTFIPVAERDQISDILNCAHVFVSPTIQEPHGIAVREAMMCGLPVVSTANGGVEDSINLDTGIIIPVKDPKALAASVLRIKNKELKFDALKIRNLAIWQCGRETFFKSMLEFYNIDKNGSAK